MSKNRNSDLLGKVINTWGAIGFFVGGATYFLFFKKESTHIFSGFGKPTLYALVGACIFTGIGYTISLLKKN